MKNWWVTLYGRWGTSFIPLENCSKETLMDMLTGKIQNYKLEALTQAERNACVCGDPGDCNESH